MNTNNEIKDWLNHIGQESGETFKCNEDAIILEISQHQSMFSNVGVKILSIFGSMLAGALFLMFLFMLDIFDSDKSMLIIGILFVICALVGNSQLNSSLFSEFTRTFFDTTIVSMYILGCTLMAIGANNINFACCLLILTALVTAVVSNKYILSFFSVLLLNGSIVGLYIAIDLIFILLYLHSAIVMVTLVYVCSNEARLIKISSKINHLYKPVVMGLFVLLTVLLIAISILGIDTVFTITICSLVFISGIMFLVWQNRKMWDIPKGKNIALYCISLLILLPTFHFPAIAGAIFMILLTFRYGHKSGFVISLALLIYAFTHYYYALEITLLAKSICLFISGILFLIIWLSLRNILKYENSI